MLCTVKNFPIMKPVIYALTLKIITAVMPLPHGRRRCRRLIFGRRFCQCLLIQEKGTIRHHHKSDEQQFPSINLPPLSIM